MRGGNEPQVQTIRENTDKTDTVNRKPHQNKRGNGQTAQTHTKTFGDGT